MLNFQTSFPKRQPRDFDLKKYSHRQKKCQMQRGREECRFWMMSPYYTGGSLNRSTDAGFLKWQWHTLNRHLCAQEMKKKGKACMQID